jgi:ribosomal-protein-alanine N-acetyltransferase
VSGPPPRVVVRRPQRGDEEEFLAGMRASTALHLPWLNAPQTPIDFREYLVRALRESSEFFLACRTEDGGIVGFLNLNEIVRGSFQSAVARFAGQGYMREGIELVLAESFGPLGLHRVEANIQPGNAASIALARGAGFVREGFSPSYLKIGGVWRDHERWAIRRELWEARRRA